MVNPPPPRCTASSRCPAGATTSATAPIHWVYANSRCVGSARSTYECQAELSTSRRPSGFSGSVSTLAQWYAVSTSHGFGATVASPAPTSPSTASAALIPDRPGTAVRSCRHR